jgi:hypothetical protein
MLKMSAARSRPDTGHAPLLGHNLVRLLYLDEAGTDQGAPIMTVSGVLVHGDQQWPEVDRRLRALIEKYIPKADQLGFVFHATDIFHGSGYFDRRKPEWKNPEIRNTILNEMAAIISDLGLPVVAGTYKKKEFGAEIPDLRDPSKHKDAMLHITAATDCLRWADIWLHRYAPSELATVVHEDGTSAKRFIKWVVKILRSPEQMEADGLADPQLGELGLPLKRIIDTVHFAEKGDARPLQLADLCAFLIARSTKNLAVPAYALKVVFRHLSWRSPEFANISDDDLVSSSPPEGQSS